MRRDIRVGAAGAAGSTEVGEAGPAGAAVNSRSWIEISEERLKENYRVVCEAAGAASQSQTGVLAVVKANAYGHGLERYAIALKRARARSGWELRTRVKARGCGGR